MVLRLAERLAVPLRERNTLLTAGGCAPVFRERPLTDPALGAARQAVELVLSGHEPYTALAIDRHWTMIASNRAIAPLLDGVAPHLLRSPVDVLRLSLHPEGLAPRIINLPQWRGHLLDRLRQQADSTADPVLQALSQELLSYPSLPRGRGGSLSSQEKRQQEKGQELGIVVISSLRRPAAASVC